MERIDKRIAKQRRLVERLGAQLSFERLVLARLEARGARAAPAGSVGRVLAEARKRRAEQAAQESRRSG